MIDWTSSMQQTYTFYKVNPITWGNEEEIIDVKSCSITRDSESELIESAKIERSDLLDECYVRVYLNCIQNGVKYEPVPLGTFLVQTPEEDYDGKERQISMDAYSPLIELKDSRPPYGFTVMAGTSVLQRGYEIISDNTRLKVANPESNDLLPDSFVSDFDNDTWLSFITDFIGTIDHHLSLDEMGRVLFAPTQDSNSMAPVWTYTDDNSSILYPDISLIRDLYGIPNVVEVMYSTDAGYKLGRAVNDDENSPISIPVRGREVVYRVTNPDDLISPTQGQIDNYAEELLRSMSALEYTISYKHGYCPVRVGDCIMLNYERAGLKNIKAVVTSQTINCVPGCDVSEKAVFTKKLWG